MTIKEKLEKEEQERNELISLFEDSEDNCVDLTQEEAENFKYLDSQTEIMD